MPSAPATVRAYTTRGAVKNQLGALVTGDSAADVVLDALILAATRAIVRFCGREFARETLDEAVVGDGSVDLMVSRTPVVAVTSVLLDNSPVVGWTLSDPEAGFLTLPGGWTDTRGWGWGLGEQRPPGQALARYVVSYTGGYLLPSDDVNVATLSAVALTQRYVDSALGLPTLVAGDRVLAAGFTNQANNGWKTVAASAPGYLEVTGGEPLVDEDAPTDDDEGTRELRVRTLPPDLEQAAIEVVKALYIARKRDASVASKRVGDLSVTYAQGGGEREPLPVSAMSLLASYERLA